MKELSLNDWLLIGIAALLVARKVMALLGWDRGALIADELRAALGEARGLILDARAGNVFQIERAAEVAASRIKGVEAAELRPIIESLVARAEDNRYGVAVALDGDGNISVDPSGLAAKFARKAGKWLKKVF